jgi:hypothetical protein
MKRLATSIGVGLLWFAAGAVAPACVLPSVTALHEQASAAGPKTDAGFGQQIGAATMADAAATNESTVDAGPALTAATAGATSGGAGASAMQPDRSTGSRSTAGSDGVSAGAGGASISVAGKGMGGSVSPETPACTMPCPVSAPCTADGQCATGSCLGQCRQPAALGGSCDTQPDCVKPLVCQSGSCKLELGNKCQHDWDCGSGSCLDVCRSFSAPGERCDTTADCEGVANCANGTCGLLLREPCGADRECETGLCGSAKRCALALGTTCVIDADCASGSCGYQGACATPAGARAECNSDPDCLAGLMCYRPAPQSDGGQPPNYCDDRT